MSRNQEDVIVFEDLHGSGEDESITIDLDADTKDDGITRTPADQAADDDDKNDDRLQIDNLRSADIQDELGADEQDDDEKTASSDGEDDEYSKKVQARIKREQRAKRKERDRADAGERRATYWEEQAKTMAKDSYERDKRSLKSQVEQAGSAYVQVQSDLEKAIEDGNTKDQVRLTTRLSDLKADQVLAETRLEELSPDGNVQPYSDKLSPSDKKSDETLASKWMDDRGDWYGANGFERQTRLANRLDKEVFADGYRPDTPDYFKELDRRIKEKEPKLYEDLDAASDDTDADDTDDTKDTRRGKNVVAPVGGNETRRQRTSSSKVELTEQDFAVMRQFNLDTNDPEVLKEFARNKREAESGAR